MRPQSAQEILFGKNNKEAYDSEKALAVLTYILRLLGDRGDKHQLIKMMYWIERISIIETGFPVFFDQVYSLPYGPILSQTLDNINSSNSETSPWYGFIRTDGRMNVILVKEGDFDELSEYDETKIKETVEKFKDTCFSDRTDFFHALPEYTKVSTGERADISYRVILEKGAEYSTADADFALLEIESAKLGR